MKNKFKTILGASLLLVLAIVFVNQGERNASAQVEVKNDGLEVFISQDTVNSLVSNPDIATFLMGLVPSEEPVFGGSAGPTHTVTQEFLAGHVEGGLYVSTTTTGVTNADPTFQVRRSGYVRYLNVNADEASTLTLPATTSLSSFVPETGQCFTQKLENSGDSNLTIGAGTGIDLQEPDGQNVVIGANNYANIEYCRTSNSDIVVTVDETIPAD